MNNSYNSAWSRVPTTGVYDKCTNSCALYKEPSEQFIFSYDRSMWQRSHDSCTWPIDMPKILTVHVQITCLLAKNNRAVGTQ